jgi:FAD/FMN-containing dehydrogenase
MTITLKTIAGGSSTLDDEALSTLEADLTGPVLQPEDPGYEEAVAIWNGMIAKKPGVVVQPRTSAEVAAAVDFAREHNIELSVKGGGHNIAGLALTDGGMTLDMGEMKTVSVDPDTKIARVGPGCTLGDVDRATQEHGLAATLGFVSQTGVAGLTLGGGFGYLTRQFGFTADDLVEAEIVLADGEVTRASRSENPDLFWALRGGGGNFGVVTEFVFALHEIGPEITGGLIAWSAEHADAVTRIYRDMTESAPAELTLALLMRNAPPAPWLAEEHHGQPIIIVVVCHTGSEEQADADLRELRSYGAPWADLIGRKLYVEQQSMLDATMPDGMHYYWKSEFVPALSDELLTDYRAQFDGLDAPANQAAFMHLAGALSGFDEDDGAVGNRDAGYVCVIQSMYPEGGPAEENREWVRSAWKALKKYSTGGNYINFQTADETDDRTAESYRGNLDRLAEVKGRYDPENLFRVNRNIKPA